MLMPGRNELVLVLRDSMCSGNTLWADPDEARREGKLIGATLIERVPLPENSIISSTDDIRVAHDEALQILAAALEVVDHPGLPAERRANVLLGVIDALKLGDYLGGEEEWVEEFRV